MLDIGSISHGTSRSEDLASALIGALLGQGWKETAQIITELRDVESGADTISDSEVIADAMDDLNNCVPPYCYFGAHEGDESDLGVWLDHHAFEQACRDRNILKISDLADLDNHDRAYLAGFEHIAVVNDHGNVTLYPVVVTVGKALWDIV